MQLDRNGLPGLLVAAGLVGICKLVLVQGWLGPIFLPVDIRYHECFVELLDSIATVSLGL